MKYLFLDTNIYIDMIVSRNNNNKADSYELLKKLLEFDKVKIILPNIVKVETSRNLIKEVKDIGIKVKTAKNAIEKVYWMNHVEQIEIYNNKITPLKSSLGALDDEFTKNETKFIKEASDKISNLFEHKNVEIIEETDELVLKVQRRKIFKACPFHIDNKDSFGDALIIETIVNIEKYINLNPEDQIYFITGNTSDFSSKENKLIFHPDIQKDLIEKGINEQVLYRTFYTKTLLQDFKDEIEEAEIVEELIQAEIEEEKIKLEQEKKDLANWNRNGIGLESLGDGDQYIDEISESHEIIELMNMIDSEIDNFKQKIEDLIDLYGDLLEDVRSENFAALEFKVINYNRNSPFLKIDYDSGNGEEELHHAIYGFINDNVCSQDYLQGVLDNISYLESFNIERLFEMRDLFSNDITIEVLGELHPSDYDSDTLEIYVGRNNVPLNKSFVEVSYGYAEYDEDGGVGDAQDLNIDYNIENVIEDFKGILSDNLEKLLLFENDLNTIRSILI